MYLAAIHDELRSIRKAVEKTPEAPEGQVELKEPKGHRKGKGSGRSRSRKEA